MPGTITIPVTAQDGTTNTYTISVVATGIKETSASSNVYSTSSSIIVDGQVGAQVSIVSVVGNVIYKGVVTDANYTLPVSLEKGVYVVLVNGISTKVIVK